MGSRIECLSYRTPARRSALSFHHVTFQFLDGTGFNASTPVYSTNADGQKTAIVSFAWTPPWDPTFGGVWVYLRYPARFLHDVQLTGLETGSGRESTIPFFRIQPRTGNSTRSAGTRTTGRTRTSRLHAVRGRLCGPGAHRLGRRRVHAACGRRRCYDRLQGHGDGVEERHWRVAWSNPETRPSAGPRWS